jgi:hypothetical protein
MTNNPKAKREPPVKFPAAVSAMKTLADGNVSLSLIVPQADLLKVTSLMLIKQDGDTLQLTAVRVRKPKEKKQDAPKKQIDKKTAAQRRVRRYPYRQ